MYTNTGEGGARGSKQRSDGSIDKRVQGVWLADDQETEETDAVEHELVNPFAALELRDSIDSTTGNRSSIVIVPKIVAIKYDDPEVEMIIEDEDENAEDMHQHFFADQIRGDRPRWTKSWYNVVAMIAFMVDLSNLTTFPNNVSKYGIAFLIAYAVILVFFAYPMLYLEVIVGQYFQTGMMGIWGLTPISRGLGNGLIYLTFLIVSILPISTLYSALYMGDSLLHIRTGDLPWTFCDNDWNTCNCTGPKSKSNMPVCLDWKKARNDTSIATNPPAMEYFVGKVLRMWRSKYTEVYYQDVTENGNWSTAFGFTNVKEGLGPLVPTNCFVLLAVFVLIILLSLANIKYIGYIYAFTTGFPISVMVLLFCRGVTLEGASDGIKMYLSTDLRLLLEVSMWNTAFENVFFSIAAGAGCHIVLSSYSSLDYNPKWDPIVSIFADTLLSLMATVNSFMLIGHLYHERHAELPEIFPGGSLIFIALAESFGSIAGSSFFAWLFYAMTIIISIDTQAVTIQALSYSIFEEFKRKYPNQEVSRHLFLFSIWGFAFAITLVCATRGGYWLFTFLLTNFFGLSTFIFMLLESIILAWIWGIVKKRIEEVCTANETLTGKRPSIFLRVSWKISIPVVLTVTLVYTNLIKVYEPITIFGQTAPPESARLGFVFQWISVALICIYPIYHYFLVRRRCKTCLEVVLLLFSPEYEHEEILANPKGAKRLKWRHYGFIMFEDEKRDFYQGTIQTVKNMMIKLKSFRTEKAPAPPPDPSISLVSKEKKKKKKKKDKEKEQEDDSAWNLWDKMKEQRRGTSSHGSDNEDMETAHAKTIHQRHSKTSKKSNTSNFGADFSTHKKRKIAAPNRKSRASRLSGDLQSRPFTSTSKAGRTSNEMKSLSPIKKKRSSSKKHPGRKIKVAPAAHEDASASTDFKELSSQRESADFSSQRESAFTTSEPSERFP